MLVRLLILGCIASIQCKVLHPDFNGNSQQYAGHKLYRLQARTKRDEQAVKQLLDHVKVEILHVPGNSDRLSRLVDVLVSPSMHEQVQVFLKNNDVEYTVKVHDMQDAIETQLQQLGSRRQHASQSASFDHSNYHPLQEIYEFLKELETTYPHLISLVEIGRSFENRPIQVVKMSGAGSAVKKPAIWLDSGIHANEWLTPATLLYFIHQFAEGYGSDHQLTWLLDSMDWYFLPVFNPDGYAYTWTGDRLWRKNRRTGVNSTDCMGVDLNRNWDFHWAERNADRDPCSRWFAGSAPFSEPETQAVQRFLSTHNDSLVAYLAYHSFSQLWMLPYSYSKQASLRNGMELLQLSELAVDALKNVHGTEYHIGHISELVGETSGASVDFAYETLGIRFAFGVELRDQGKHGTLLPPDQILPNSEEALAAIKVTGLFVADSVGAK